jgi:hypothetical protein
MAVRLTVRGGIVDVPAPPSDGKTLVKLLKRPPGEVPAPAVKGKTAVTPDPDAVALLEQLHALKEKGVLSDEEFMEKKAEILRRI